MPPLKSGQRGRLRACALWGLQRIESTSRAYLGCIHDSVDRAPISSSVTVLIRRCPADPVDR
jgi:hypothetical protein